MDTSRVGGDKPQSKPSLIERTSETTQPEHRLRTLARATNSGISATDHLGTPIMISVVPPSQQTLVAIGDRTTLAVLPTQGGNTSARRNKPQPVQASKISKGAKRGPYNKKKRVRFTPVEAAFKALERPFEQRKKVMRQVWPPLFEDESKYEVVEKRDMEAMERNRLQDNSLGPAEERVSLWDPHKKKRLAGAAAPSRKNLDEYLAKRPHFQVYYGQKSLHERDVREGKVGIGRMEISGINTGCDDGVGEGSVEQAASGEDVAMEVDQQFE